MGEILRDRHGSRIGEIIEESGGKKWLRMRLGIDLESLMVDIQEKEMERKSEKGIFWYCSLKIILDCKW